MTTLTPNFETPLQGRAALATMKVQLKQPLDRDDLIALRNHQAVNTANAQYKASTGGGKFLGGAPTDAQIAQSNQQLVRGTPLDTVAGARESEIANQQLETLRRSNDPLAGVKYEAAVLGIDPNQFGSPTALSNAVINRKNAGALAAQQGISIEQAERQMTPLSVATAAPLENVSLQPSAAPTTTAPAAPLAPEAPLAPTAQPAPAKEDAEALTPTQRVLAALPAEYNVNAKDPEEVVSQQFARRYGNRTMSAIQVASARDAIRKEINPTRQTRSVLDPLTRDAYEVEVLADSLGNIYQRGEPTFKSAGPNKKIDEEFQKDITNWVAGGEAAKSRADLEKLRSAIEVLNDDSTVAGSGAIVGLLPEAVRKTLQSNRTASAQAAVESVAQESMRKILGAQFTEKEGERLLARTFDPKMDEKENARRAQALLQTLEDMAATKDEAAKYFAKNGTIQGFKQSKNTPAAALAAPSTVDAAAKTWAQQNFQ